MVEIYLNDGHTLLVDEIDFPLINRYRWYAKRNPRTWYAAANVVMPDGRRLTFRLHRLIMSPQADQRVDHIDGNGLNNTRDNLRVCSSSQNQGNARRRVDNRSGYKGVAWFKANRKWRAQIQHQGQKYFLGYFTSAEDAARAYNIAARKLFGEFGCLNFPEVNDGHA